MLKLRAASPFAAIARERWSELGNGGATALAYDELAGLSGLGEPVAVDEVTDVYVPLARLLALRVEAARELSATQNAFLGETHTVPFLVALGGSVAVGKSTAARLIVRLLASLRPDWRVELVTTDGFLLPNATLIERDILARKGFPETYDRRRAAALRGRPQERRRRRSRAPLYSHLRYDVTEEVQHVRAPDVLLLEGVNVLQRGSGRVYVSDFVDFALYLDAEEDDVRRWYLERFLDAAQRRLPEPGLLLPPLRAALRRGGGRGRERHLGAHEPPEPAQQHPAHAPARGRDPREGPRPLRVAGAAAAGVIALATQPARGLAAGRVWSSRIGSPRRRCPRRPTGRCT